MSTSFWFWVMIGATCCVGLLRPIVKKQKKEARFKEEERLHRLEVYQTTGKLID